MGQLLYKSHPQDPFVTKKGWLETMLKNIEIQLTAATNGIMLITSGDYKILVANTSCDKFALEEDKSLLPNFQWILQE